jgi:hypothetical protein
VQPIITNYGVIAKTGGAGTTDFGSFALSERGALTVQPNTILHFTDAVSFDGSSQIIGGKALFDGNAPVLKAPVTIAGGSSLEVSSGLVAATDGSGNPLGSIDGPGTFSWRAGTIGGKLNLGSLLNWQIDTAGNPYLDSATINHYGTAAVGGGTGNLGGYNSILNIEPGAFFQVNAPTYFRNAGVPPTIVNAGMFKIGAAGIVVNSDWNYQQSASGTLDLQVAGKGAAPAQFSRMLVNGTVNFGGTLSTHLLNKYLPNIGDAFALVTYNSGSGQFANVQTPGFKFSTAYNSNDFSLVGLAQPTLAEWKQGYFADPNSPQAADTAAPAGDGVANLLKYALGLNPTLPIGSGGPLGGFGTSAAALPRGEAETAANGTQHFTLNFRRIDPANVTYVVQASDNISTQNGWTEIARLNVGTTTWFGSAGVIESGTGSTRQVVVTDAFTLQQKPRRFFRLLVSH